MACRRFGFGRPKEIRLTSITQRQEPRRSGRSGRRAAPAAALAVAGLLIASCGTGLTAPVAPTQPTPSRSADPSGAAAPSATPAAAPSNGGAPATARFDPRADGLDVTLDEFGITLEASTVRPGPVTLVVHNAGRLTLGFEMKIEHHGSGGERLKIEARTIRSGETLRVEANLLPGTYEIECSVADDDSRELRTMLEVRSDAPLATSVPGGQAPSTARIVQYAFVAADVTVAAGTWITWTNEDPTPHTVTADGGAFDSRQMDPGDRFRTVFSTAGDYPFHCEIHPTMAGVIHVR